MISVVACRLGCSNANPHAHLAGVNSRPPQPSSRRLQFVAQHRPWLSTRLLIELPAPLLMRTAVSRSPRPYVYYSCERTLEPFGDLAGVQDVDSEVQTGSHISFAACSQQSHSYVPLGCVHRTAPAQS